MELQGKEEKRIKHIYECFLERTQRKGLPISKSNLDHSSKEIILQTKNSKVYFCEKRNC